MRPLGLTGKYEIDGCGDSFKVEGKVGPASVEWDGSEVEGKLSKDIFEDDDGGASDGKTIKCKPQVKGAYEKCWKTWP